MDDAARVGVGERVADLPAHLHGVLDREASSRGEDPVERSPVEHLENEVRSEAKAHARVERLDEARVPHCRQRMGLTEQAAPRLVFVAKLLGQELQRDDPARELVMGFEDEPHAAMSNESA